MLMRPAMLAGGKAPVQLRGYTSAAPPGTTATVALPAGSQVGDICFIIVTDNGGTPTIAGAGGSGWARTEVATTSSASCFAKKLTAAEITGPIIVGCTASPILCTVFQGADGFNLLTSAGTTQNTSTSQNFTGTTKGAAARAIVIHTFNISGSAAVMAVSAPTLANLAYAPTSADAQGSAGAASYECRTAFDVYPAEYVNGTTITWGNYGTALSAKFIWVYEIT